MTDRTAMTTTTTTTDIDNELDAFAETAAANLQRNTGALLTYKKRKFLYGKEKTELPLGTEMIAIMHEIKRGHVKWIDGRIVKLAIGRVVDRFKPDRDVLGDHDKSEWPFDYNGKQSDPWVHTVYIPMVTRSGEEQFTFSTHSFFGREAAYRLFQHYAAQAPQHPNCYPVVRLGSTTNPTKKYGDIDSPELPIVDWQDRPQQAIASIPPIEEVDERPPSRSGGSFNRDMDDDIPF
jgi:hypothetical protein